MTGKRGTLSIERACQLMFAETMRTVAHAVGSPLNVILGRAELLLEDDPEERAPSGLRRGLRSIRDQCEKIRANIERPLSAAEAVDNCGVSISVREICDERAWLDGSVSQRIDVAAVATSREIDADDGVLALWALTLLGSRLSAGQLELRAEEVERQVEFSVALAHVHPIKSPRELSQPWLTTELSRSTWIPALLLHAVAAHHGGTPRVSATGVSVRLNLS